MHPNIMLWFKCVPFGTVPALMDFMSAVFAITKISDDMVYIELCSNTDGFRIIKSIFAMFSLFLTGRDNVIIFSGFNNREMWHSDAKYGMPSRSVRSWFYVHE